jgi:hypothetical protein
MLTHRRTAITARSVAGGGWLISGERKGTAWVEAATCCQGAPHELERIASLGRALILAGEGGRGCLRPSEVRWLLAKPERVACLIDFLTASEDPVRAMTTPLRVTFTSLGEVRWRFVPARRDGPGLVVLPGLRRGMRCAA